MTANDESVQEAETQTGEATAQTLSTAPMSDITSTSSGPSDEEMRKLLKPNPTNEQVAEALQQSYVSDGGTVTILKELDSYDDRNYLVQMQDGTRYLAKVHNGVESENFVSVYKKTNDYHTCGMDSVIHLQNAIMEHLNTQGIPTSVPQLCCDDNETETAEITAPSPVSIHTLPVVSDEYSPRQLVVRLLSWVPGRTMASLSVLPVECLADAGRFLGNMDNKLDMVDCSLLAASKRIHEWDGKNTVQLRQFLPCIKNSDRRALVTSVIDAFQHDLVDGGVHKSFRQGLLQADFNDANILVNNDFEVSGVIDFGDSVKSWRVLDISVAMTYAMLSVYGKANRRLSAACAMLRGFHSVYPLRTEEREQLQLLMACRLACSATLGAYSYQQNPENEYLLLHAEPAWKALELIWGYGLEYRRTMKETLAQMFDIACDDCKKARKNDTDGVIDCSDLSLPDPNVIDVIAHLRPVARDVLGSLPAKRTKAASKMGTSL